MGGTTSTGRLQMNSVNDWKNKVKKLSQIFYGKYPLQGVRQLGICEKSTS